MSKRTIGELVIDARNRISAMRIAPPAGEVSSRAAADEFEIAIDALVASLPVGRTADFYDTVAKVEERFQTAYDRAAVGNAKTEGQMAEAGTQVSLGWFVVLSRAGIAIRMGNTEPDYKAGDTMVFMLQRLPRKPEAPQLAVVPPAPPPMDLETARKIWTDHLASLSPEERSALVKASLPEYEPQ